MEKSEGLGTADADSNYCAVRLREFCREQEETPTCPDPVGVDATGAMGHPGASSMAHVQATRPGGLHSEAARRILLVLAMLLTVNPVFLL